jgi:response regulator NasT
MHRSSTPSNKFRGHAFAQVIQENTTCLFSLCVQGCIFAQQGESMSGNQKGYIAPVFGTASRPPRTVLLVDDDSLVLESLGNGLAGAGCIMLCAASVDEAERLLAGGPRPDIAIIDVVMPERSGLDLVPRLRELGCIPFVMLSAYSDAPTVEQATAAGALAYLVKPVDVVRLLPAIEAALACAAELGELRKIREQLQTALDSDRDTDVAVGVTMVQHEIGRTEAFDLLRDTARSQRRKLTELAQEIVAAQEALNHSTNGSAES